MDAASLVAATHGAANRLIADARGAHFEGASQAARVLKRDRILPASAAKKLDQLAVAFAITRHITSVSVRNFLSVLKSELQQSELPGSSLCCDNVTLGNGAAVEDEKSGEEVQCFGQMRAHFTSTSYSSNAHSAHAHESVSDADVLDPESPHDVEKCSAELTGFFDIGDGVHASTQTEFVADVADARADPHMEQVLAHHDVSPAIDGHGSADTLAMGAGRTCVAKKATVLVPMVSLVNNCEMVDAGHARLGPANYVDVALRRIEALRRAKQQSAAT